MASDQKGKYTFSGLYDTWAWSVTHSPQLQKEKNPRTDIWDALMEEQIKGPSLVKREALGTLAFSLEEYIILYTRKKEWV